MEKKSILSLLIILFCIQQVVLAQQNSKYENIQYKHNQKEVCVSMYIQLQNHYINMGDSLTLTPIIKSGTKTTILPNIIMIGNNQMFYSSNDKNALSKDKNSQTNITYKVNTPYEPWMENAELILSTSLNQVGGTELYSYTEVLKKNPTLEYNKPINLVSNNVQVVNSDSIKSILFSLRYPYKKAITIADSNEMGELKDFMNRIISNDNITLIRIDINAITSIDGTYSDNEQLTLKQATAFKNYLQQSYNIPESYFQVKGSSEDWDGLAKQVEDSDMPYKQEVLNIMSKYGIFNGREKELMLLKSGEPYIYMKNNMFPESQRVECKIVYRIKE